MTRRAAPTPPIRPTRTPQRSAEVRQVQRIGRLILTNAHLPPKVARPVMQDDGTVGFSYRFKHYVDGKDLPVTVHVGRGKAGWPSRWAVTTTWNKQARGTVWFPHGTTGPHIVAHEAVHVAQWAMQLLGDDPANYRGIVPGYCPSWKSGGDEVLAEAFARIVDQFVERFELERARRGYLHR